MSSCITTAFEAYLQACITSGTKVALNEIVLAYIPGLDHTATPPRSEGMPSAADIVYRQAIDKSGKLGANSVAYSIVMDTHVGDFSFNAMYLINKASNTVAMVVYKQVETKISTNGAIQGNSIIKTMVMEYSGAALSTGITVDAGTWQVDMSGQLQNLQSQINDKADIDHGHNIDDINELQAALNGKSARGHGHEISEVSGLQEALDSKSAKGHGHEISEVSGLQEELNSKSATGHGHGIKDVTGLESALNNKSDSNHQHEMNGIKGLTAAIGNIPERLTKEMTINVPVGSDGWVELDGFFVASWDTNRSLSIKLPTINAYHYDPVNTEIPIAVFVDGIEKARQSISMTVGQGSASGWATISLIASVQASARRTISIKALVNNRMKLTGLGQALYELFTTGRSFS